MCEFRIYLEDDMDEHIDLASLCFRSVKMMKGVSGFSLQFCIFGSILRERNEVTV